MNELMIALMVWASPVVGLPVPEEPPVIVHKEFCELQEMLQLDCREDGYGVYGAAKGKVVWLVDTWKVDNLYDVSTLLHELVHYMQFQHGVSLTPCIAESLEAPAYDAQIKFLEAAGVDPLKTMKIDKTTLFFSTKCFRPY